MTSLGDVVIIDDDPGPWGPTRRGQVVSVPGQRDRTLLSIPLADDEFVIRLSPGIDRITNHPQDYQHIPYERWTHAEKIRSIIIRGPDEYRFDDDDDAERQALDEWHARLARVLAGTEDDEDWQSWEPAIIAAAERIDRMTDIGRRSAAWRARRNYGLTLDHMGFKLTEEIGEFAKACIGRLEHRDGRGDPGREAAQAVLLLAALLHQHFDLNLWDLVVEEMEINGA